MQDGESCDQTLATGIVAHALLRWNKPAVDQTLSALDAAQTCHNGEDMLQKQVARMIAQAIVVGRLHESLQEWQIAKARQND